MNARYFYSGLVIFMFIVIFHLGVKPFELLEGMSNLSILASDALPPDTSILHTAIEGLIETLEIAFLGTIVGFSLSLPLSLLAARNINNRAISYCCRMILAGIRTLPSLLWAVIFVIIVGFGPLAGILATIMYTIGYVGKLAYEAFESVDKEILDAISIAGANKLQLIRYVIIPESAHHLLSHLLFMFDYNVRASTILGFVGAGGIGFYIQTYLQFLAYDKVLMMLIVVFIAVVAIDMASVWIRKKYID